MGEVKRELWVGTADIKDVYIRQGRGEAAPLTRVFAELLESPSIISQPQKGFAMYRASSQFPHKIHSS